MTTTSMTTAVDTEKVSPLSKEKAERLLLIEDEDPPAEISSSSESEDEDEDEEEDENLEDSFEAKDEDEEEDEEEDDEEDDEEEAEDEDEDDDEDDEKGANEKKDPLQPKDWILSDKDINSAYYRAGYHNYQISDAKSALQKEIRRSKDFEARFWAMVLLCSHKVENLMNRLLVIASEDISIADCSVVHLARLVHDFYLAERKKLKAKGGKGTWKELRNNLQLRSQIAMLVTALAKAPKCRIVDHALSLLCPANRLEKTTDELVYKRVPDHFKPNSHISLPQFRTIVRKLTQSNFRAYSEEDERRAFDELRKVLRPPEGWKQLTDKKALRVALNFQKRKMEAAFDVLYGEGPHTLTAILADLKVFANHRNKFASVKSHMHKGMPGKVHLAHVLFLFTRKIWTVESFKTMIVTRFDEESTTRYAEFIAKKSCLTIPAYSLDRHTAGHHNAEGVDKTLTGFFTREFQALTPKPFEAFYDPYYLRCIEMMQQRDQEEGNAAASSNKRKVVEKPTEEESSGEIMVKHLKKQIEKLVPIELMDGI